MRLWFEFNKKFKDNLKFWAFRLASARWSRCSSRCLRGTCRLGTARSQAHSSYPSRRFPRTLSDQLWFSMRALLACRRPSSLLCTRWCDFRRRERGSHYGHTPILCHFRITLCARLPRICLFSSRQAYPCLRVGSLARDRFVWLPQYRLHWWSSSPLDVQSLTPF